MQGKGGTIVGVIGLGVVGFFIVAAIFQLNSGGQTGVATQGAQAVTSLGADAFKAA